MNTALALSLRSQLTERHQRLETTIRRVGQAEDLVRLLNDVDTAIERLEADGLTRCEVCGDGLEEVLPIQPMTPYCLCGLSPEQQAALEDDLDLARRIQTALLPEENLEWVGWSTHYRYLPAGPVSGDYVDLLRCDSEVGKLFFALGDVSGKGVAASFLMAHLNALFRSLSNLDLSLQAVVERANSIFTKSTTDSHYATLVCGWAAPTGEVKLANAGHVLPLVVRGGEVTELTSTGLPVGLFGESPYEVLNLRLEPGDTLFAYSDGLSEARDAAGNEFGDDAVARFLADAHTLPPAELAAAALEEINSFRATTCRADDLTILVLRRSR